MTNQDGGDTGRDGFPETLSTGRLLHSNIPAPGGGEVIIPVEEALEKTEGNLLLITSDKDETSTEVDSKPKPKQAPRKVSLSRRKRPASLSRSKSGAEKGGAVGAGKWGLGGYRNVLFNSQSPSSELITVFLAFFGLTLLTFFVCLVATKIVVEGCEWSMCIRYSYHEHHGKKNGIGSRMAVAAGGEGADCVFRRFIPNSQFPVVEIIHDFNSRHSVLIERHQHGLKCMLFDMGRYIQTSDPCPSSYPKSMDERVGVPARKSRLSYVFSRRFSRLYVTSLKSSAADLEALAGAAIAERCAGGSLDAVLLVQVRMEDRRCRPARQSIVDQMLAMSDASYRPVRSQRMTDLLAETVVLYENWNQYIESLIESGGKATAVNGRVNNTRVSVRLEDSVLQPTSGNSEPVAGITSEPENPLQRTNEDENRDVEKLQSKDAERKGDLERTTKLKGGVISNARISTQKPPAMTIQQDAGLGGVDKAIALGSPKPSRTETTRSESDVRLVVSSQRQGPHESQVLGEDSSSHGAGVTDPDKDDVAALRRLTAPPTKNLPEDFTVKPKGGLKEGIASLPDQSGKDVESIPEREKESINGKQIDTDAEAALDNTESEDAITASGATATQGLLKPASHGDDTGISITGLFRLVEDDHPAPGSTEVDSAKSGQVQAATLFTDLSVQIEARRYYLWHGRIVRVCDIPDIP